MKRIVAGLLLLVGSLLVEACSSSTGTEPPRETAVAPTFSPTGPFNFGAPLQVELATTTAGATIHYTLDGSTPTSASPAYAAPLTLSTTATVKALATLAGMNDSAVATGTFTHRPVSLQVDSGTWGPNGGTSIATQFVMLNRFTPAAEDFPFRLRTVEVAFFTHNAGLPIRLAIYSDADGDPANGATLQLVEDVTVLNNGDEVAGMTWSVYQLAHPVTLQGPGDVLVGYIVLPPTNDFSWPLNDVSQGRSLMAYWNATVPNPPVLPPDHGYIDMGYNILVRASN
jgi:hypothetical protein